jgi:hypothetical protein
MKGRLYYDPMMEEYFIITEQKENINITNRLNNLVGCSVEISIDEL